MKIKETNNLLFWGSPSRKPLYQWITKVDLAKWNILVKDPLHIRNFICQYTDYTSDLEQFGFSEFWQDPKLIFEISKDDCEGLNGLVCSIFYTLGFDCRLCIGNYNSGGKYDHIELYKRPLNHAYGLYFDTPDTTNPYIIECTSNAIVSKLTRINDNSKYYTFYMGSGIYQKNYLCNHLVEGGEE